MNPALQYDEPGGLASGVLAVLVHLLLLAFLIVGVRWQSSRPEAVVVELWDRAPVSEPEAPPPPEPAPKVAEPPPQTKIEPKPEPKLESKPDIALEREKKAKPKATKKEEPPLKFDRRRIREEQAREVARQVAREEEALRQSKPRADATRAAAPAAAPDAGYINKIRNKIQPNIYRPDNIQGNPEAIFHVIQIPTGDIIQVKLQKSSGNTAYDDAVERAIRMSSPLPPPDKPEQFRRELTLKFRPQE